LCGGRLLERLMSNEELDLVDALPAAWEQEEDASSRDLRELAAAPAPDPPPWGWVADWGRLLRIARQVAGLSLTDLAGRTGLSKGYLSKLESGAMGAANPSRATLAALARALPSFRPLALTLAPGLAPGLGAEDLAFELVTPPPTAAAPEEGRYDLVRLRLGWKELEVLAALMVLECAALPHPLTASLIARSIDRAVASVRTTLSHLCHGGLVREILPRSAGQRAQYEAVEGALHQVGAARVGDLLLLATALIGTGIGAASAARVRSPAGAVRGRHEDE
jgi:transcriptional regulator with XRE-family HTH domain